MNKNLQEPTEQVSARRRLVRGAFAAPAALTLYSGSAFAATSLSCVAKEIANPNYPGTIATPSPSDTYLRVQLWTLPGTTTMSSWVRGADVTALQILNTPVPYITSSQWQNFSVGNPAEVTINVVAVTPVAGTVYNGQPTVGSSIPVQNGAYAAIRIDSSGKIVGVVGLGVGNPGTSAVHDSCWASFKPVP